MASYITSLGLSFLICKYENKNSALWVLGRMSMVCKRCHHLSVMSKGLSKSGTGFVHRGDCALLSQAVGSVLCTVSLQVTVICPQVVTEPLMTGQGGGGRISISVLVVTL